MRFLLAVLAVTAMLHTVSGQERYSPWGAVPEADMKMPFYAPDSTATAVILQDVGNIHLDEKNSGDWVVIFSHWRRIKIFDVTAFDKGNLFIPFAADKAIEKMNDLDVQVIYPDGTVVKIKSDNIYAEQVSEHWKVKKIFIPNLQKGCIIEYRYKLTKTYIDGLYDWYFQTDIPVRWSEVEVIIPDFFNYGILLKNLGSLALDEEGKDLKERMKFGGKYKAKVSRFGMANMPALKEEPFITTIDDYRAGIRFQKDYTSAAGNPEESADAWKSFATDLCLLREFGGQFLYEGYFQQLWDDFRQQIKGDSGMVVVEKARSFIASHIKWNKEFSMYASMPVDKAYSLKQGNSAEVNLALVALLLKAGLDVSPVLVSTRDNGRAQTKYPFFRQFNSVIAYVHLGDNSMMIDATDPYLPLGQLNLSHYNKNGWKVNPDHPDWLEITPPEASMVWLANMRLDETGVMKGSLDIQMNNDVAASWRSAIKKDEPEQLIREQVLSKYKDSDIDSLVYIDKEDITKPLRAKMNLTLNEGGTVINDYIYVKPVLDFLIVDNPFKSEKRTYPVSFPTPMKGNYIINLEIPPDYELADLPKPERITLPDGDGSISFSCTRDAVHPRKIQVSLKMQLKAVEFAPENYEALRRYFNLIAEKTDLQLVLKKEQ